MPRMSHYTAWIQKDDHARLFSVPCYLLLMGSPEKLSKTGTGSNPQSVQSCWLPLTERQTDRHPKCTPRTSQGLESLCSGTASHQHHCAVSMSLWEGSCSSQALIPLCPCPAHILFLLPSLSEVRLMGTGVLGLMGLLLYHLGLSSNC